MKENSQKMPETFPKKLESLDISQDCLELLEAMPAVFDEVIPLNQRHRMELRHVIRSLWEDLTSEREHRTAEYLSAPTYYSAYIRYFLPWNVMRLSSIFSHLPLSVSAGATIIDIGSGPLTVPIALYAARPDLRGIPLTIYCTDKTAKILSIGKTVFESLCAKTSGALPPWDIVPLRHAFGKPPVDKVDLLTAANVFNEFFWKGKAPLGERALLTARQLLGYVKEDGSVFLMEPGDPRSGSFISAVRAALDALGAPPVAPCPHANACPMPGLFRSLGTPDGVLPAGMELTPLKSVIMPKRREKYPWCHFTISADSAPSWLKNLSDEAKLPKEKLVFSYLLAGRAPRNHAEAKLGAKKEDLSSLVRVISEAFPLPGYSSGRYACSSAGYSLLKYRAQDKKLSSGDLVPMPQTASGSPKTGGRERTRQTEKRPDRPAASPGNATRPSQEFDEKSGAVIMSY